MSGYYILDTGDYYHILCIYYLKAVNKQNNNKQQPLILSKTSFVIVLDVVYFCQCGTNAQYLKEK